MAHGSDGAGREGGTATIDPLHLDRRADEPAAADREGPAAPRLDLDGPPPAHRSARVSPEPPRANAAWQAQVQARAAELEVELRYVDPARAGAAGVVAEVEALLTRARRIAERRGGVRTWWTGAPVEMAWRALHVAEHNLYAVQTEGAVVGRIPEVTASAQAYLKRNDPVASTFASWEESRAQEGTASSVSDGDRHLLRSVVDAAHRASSTQIAKVRSFRNVLALASLLLVAVLTAIAVVGWSRPELIPLCGQGDGVLVCPPLGGPAPSSWGVVQVLLFGAFGGAVGGVFSISHQRGTRVPYQVPVVQALLKVPAGAATALLGVVLLQSNLAPGMSALSATAVAGYAMLFGYAQQLLTTFVDRRAGEVLAPAQPRSDEAAEDAR